MRSIRYLVLGLSLVGFVSSARADYPHPYPGPGYGGGSYGQMCSVNGNYYPNCAPGLVCTNVNYSGIGVCGTLSYQRCYYHSDCGYAGYCQNGYCTNNNGGWGGGHGGRPGHGGWGGHRGHRHHNGCGH